MAGKIERDRAAIAAFLILYGAYIIHINTKF
jgi:hypothetical protein